MEDFSLLAKMGSRPADDPTTTATLHTPESAALPDQPADDRFSRDLVARYWQILQAERLSWTEHHRLVRLLGSGGHGYVYLSEGRGTDGFTLPVALKIFSPERHPDHRAYDDAMRQIARIAAQVARIQQDNLVDVHHWIDRGWVRVMEMEWIDGFDLRRLLTRPMLETLRRRVSPERLSTIDRVVVTEGPSQPRLKPGVATAIIRDCLAALDALHRAGIIHADVKPSNVMIKRTGNTKLIDVGSAFEIGRPAPRQGCTPAYAAPEVLERAQWSPQSDLASLGYMLIEMLSGVSLFAGLGTYQELWEAKCRLSQRLDEVLPGEVVCNDLLMSFCRRLIAVKPAERFVSAEEADSPQGGAASFHRQLVKGDLSSEYDTEIRRWLSGLAD